MVPITVGPHRAKVTPLDVRRSYFAPTENQGWAWACGGGAGYRPRVRAAYYVAIYRHSQPKPTASIYALLSPKKRCWWHGAQKALFPSHSKDFPNWGKWLRSARIRMHFF